MTSLLDEIYQEAQDTVCPDCGGECELVLTAGATTSIVCEKCGYVVACYDDSEPRNEAAIYY